MNQSKSLVDRLKQMLSLETQREELQGRLDGIIEKIAELNKSLTANGSSSVAVPARIAKAVKAAKAALPAAAVTTAKAPSKSGRAPRGSLKEQIFAALEKAGAAGVRVTDLAKELDTKPANIHAWFFAAVKRYPEVKKVEGGHYRIAGKGAASKSQANNTVPAKAKSAAAAPAKTASGREPRGELSGRILTLLGDAGAAGITVADLSEKLDKPYKNVSIWFATTGKKNRKIKKVGKAQYKLAA